MPMLRMNREEGARALMLGWLLRLLRITGWSCIGAGVASALHAYNLHKDPHFTTEIYALGFVFALPAMLIAGVTTAASSRRMPKWAAILLGWVAAPLCFIAYMSNILPGFEIYYPVTIPAALISLIGLTASSRRT